MHNILYKVIEFLNLNFQPQVYFLMICQMQFKEDSYYDKEFA
jgi:hypothetical protein